MRYLWIPALLLACAGAQAAPSMWALLPGDGTLAGWVITAGADKKTATASGLYDMYDGAAPNMLHAGVTAAAQRVYRKGNLRVTLDLLRFVSPAKAGAYYSARQSEIAKTKGYRKLTSLGQGACQARLCRSTLLYLWAGGYYCSLSVGSNSEGDAATLQAFARYLAGKIASAR